MSRRYAAAQLAAGGRQGLRVHRLQPAAYRVLLVMLLLASQAALADTLPFIEDDYAKAVARAKTKDVPLFVEMWAPW